MNDRTSEGDQLNEEQQFWRYCDEVGMMQRRESHKKTSNPTTNSIRLKMNRYQHHQLTHLASNWA